MKMIIFKFLKLFFDIFLLGVNTMKRILFSRGHFAYILSIIILLVLILFFLGLYCGFGKGDGEGKGEVQKEIIIEKTNFKISVYKNEYLYESERISIDDFIDKLKSAKGDVSVQVVDDNASLKAYKTLTDRLKKENISYISN